MGLSEDVKKWKASQPQSQTQQQVKRPGVLDNAANAVNNAFEFTTNLPVLKQAKQAVGLVSGLGGTLVGGAVGAIGTPISNTIQGKPTFSKLGENTRQSAVSTGSFGQQIGEAGAGAAMLGPAGRIPNLLLAGSQAYQGVKDIQQGKYLEGGIEAATGALGFKGASKGLQVPKLKPVDVPKVYREVLNPTKTEITNLEIRQNKNLDDLYNFMAERKVIPKRGEGNRLDTLGEIERLQSEIDSPSEQLNQLLQSRPQVKFDLTRVANRAKSEVDKTNISAIEKKMQKADIDEIMQAEIEAFGKLTDGLTINKIKQGLWKMGYNAQKPTANKVARRLGHVIKEEIETKYKDTSVRELNTLLAKYIDIITLLRNANGRVIKGGELARKVSGLVGALAGSPIPFVGSVGGYMVGKKVNEFLSNPERKIKRATK